MKTIGLLGGMSWESAQIYYQTINRQVRDAHPNDGLTSAPIILDSINFAPMAQWQRDGNWLAAGQLLAQRAQMLEAAGAEVLGLCTNTMHKVYDTIVAAIDIPMIHIAQPTIAALQASGIQRAAFLGTRLSMSESFLYDVYAAHGIELVRPDSPQQDIIHQIIMQELCQGSVQDSSREAYLTIIDQLQQRGAQAVVLGCTEITLLIRPEDCTLPIFDTTDLHAQALANVCMSDIKP